MKKFFANILILAIILTVAPNLSFAAGSKVNVTPDSQILNEGGPAVEYVLRLSQPIVSIVQDPTVDISVSYVNPEDEGRLVFSQEFFQITEEAWAAQVPFTISAADDSYLNQSDTVEVLFTVESEAVFYDAYTVTLEVLIEDDETVDQVYVNIDSPEEGAVLNSNTFEVSGSTIPGYTVTVYADETTELGTVIADEFGAWSLTATGVELENGQVSLSATAKELLHYAFLTNIDKIDVVNVENRLIVETIDTRGVYNFSDVIYDPVGNYAYAIGQNGADNKNYVLKINGYTLAIEDTVMLSEDFSYETYGLAVDEDGEYLYAVHSIQTEGTETYVAKVNLDSFELNSNFRVLAESSEPYSGIGVNNDTGTLWVRTATGALIYNLDDFTLINVLNFGDGALGRGNIVFNNSGTKAYLPDSDLGTVFVVDALDYDVTSIADLEGVIMVAITPDDSKLFAVSPVTSRIYAIDLVNNVIIDSTFSDRPPESIAITQDGLSWIVGDDHASGYIYFGFVFMNSNTLDVLVNPDGGSYTSVSSNFVTNRATTATVSVNFDIPRPSSGGSSSGSKSNRVLASGKILTYEEEVESAIEKGVVTENPAGFANKCEALLMMSRVFDWELDLILELDYTDVPSWCYEVASFATDRGIVEGRTKTTLGMESPVTRYEVATMIYRELKFQSYKFNGDNSLIFTDNLVDWAKESVLALAREGIIKGFSDSTFGGDEGVRKQDLAVMLLRVVEN
jgi:hypothetical protein